ncbi:MAG: ABC transporter ATP-binding protein [Candidatus Pacebacteria bacterium]|nr:ABC transporter ATP-binding protein [Candidatus Paceibacterota bacterium]
MDSSQPLIEAVDLTKTYADGTVALRGASFIVHEGEFVAIMGPSGSGKSTLLHILGFLDPQTTGTYRFKGATKDEMSPLELARVRNEELGFVFQQFNLLPHETVLSNVYLPLYYSDVPNREWKDRAEKAIVSVGLSHRLSAEAYTLSGGEKQRVAIARALINNPTLIFADEPTGNLDSASGTAVMEILTRLHAEGRTVILITHDEDIAKYAQRTLVVRDGVLKSDITRSL